ncbi:MAG: hypothetical protein IKH16_13365 [Selenomonadaceae bacterium]|nr:hypothetical protein [Selenomonadaceae bacterium]
MKLTKEEFLSLKERIKSPLFKSMAAVIINPQIIQEEITLPVDVNDVYSPSYGQTFAYKGQKPEGTQ